MSGSNYTKKIADRSEMGPRAESHTNISGRFSAFD